MSTRKQTPRNIPVSAIPLPSRGHRHGIISAANISTLATVGFGDVHPTGQLARAAVTIQIVFNLVFLGAAVSLISGFFRARATGRLQAGSAGRGPDDFTQ